MSILEKNGKPIAVALTTASALTAGVSAYTAVTSQNQNEEPVPGIASKANTFSQAEVSDQYYIDESENDQPATVRPATKANTSKALSDVSNAEVPQTVAEVVDVPVADPAAPEAPAAPAEEVAENEPVDFASDQVAPVVQALDDYSEGVSDSYGGVEDVTPAWASDPADENVAYPEDAAAAWTTPAPIQAAVATPDGQVPAEVPVETPAPVVNEVPAAPAEIADPALDGGENVDPAAVEPAYTDAAYADPAAAVQDENALTEPVVEQTVYLGDGVLPAEPVLTPYAEEVYLTPVAEEAVPNPVGEEIALPPEPVVSDPAIVAPTVPMPDTGGDVYGEPLMDPSMNQQTVADPYAALNTRIADEAIKLVGVTNGLQCTEVVQMALANAGVVDAQSLWPRQYADTYGYITDNPQPGNLIYYNQGGDGLDHIAVYIGNDEAVHGNYDVGDGTSQTVIAPAEVIGCDDFSYIQVER